MRAVLPKVDTLRRQKRGVRSLSSAGALSTPKASFVVAGIRVDVEMCDILSKSPADAVVSCANMTLCGSVNKSYWMFAGRKNVETRIHEEAGPALLEELRKISLQDGATLESKVKGSPGRTCGWGVNVCVFLFVCI